jgi:hypothetical protein
MWEVVLFFSLAIGCLVIYLLHWHRLTKAMRWVGVAHAINTVSMGTGQLLTSYGWQNNLFIFHFSIIFLYTAYALAFYSALDDHRVRRLILFSIVFYTLASLLITATIQPINEYNSYALILFNLLLVGWSLTHLYSLFRAAKIAHLEQDAFFWISSGLLFTSAGNFLVTGLMRYMIHRSLAYASNMYLLIDVMGFLLIIILIVAIYANRLFTTKRLGQ